ncbi:MAG: MBL fold metallo-hydrolase [Gammaproteobacteria bacterium]|nr:MBL fold metallo-hydrolase [Gammaproteobacteria bacterium]NNL50085.1 MBL fold metallo-hydrolase [Woeseiaceae bacterium]
MEFDHIRLSRFSAWVLGLVRIPVMIGAMHAMRVLFLLLLAAASACADTESRLEYLANEGVAVFHRDTTLLFDPLFRIDHGYYVLVQEATRTAMLTRATPFENVAAIFVSHYHSDHFDPVDMLQMMTVHESTRLYAPRQAIDAMRQLAAEEHRDLFDRVESIDLSYEDDPQLLHAGDISVQAFFVPHSGWPTARTDVQNIAFRVTVDDQVSVAHLGDSDPNLIHFERHEQAWHAQQTDVALPPYWFFDSRDGNDILSEVIRSRHSIGVHVPAAFSDRESIPEDLRGFDLFIEPGESRPWIRAPELPHIPE